MDVKHEKNPVSVILTNAEWEKLTELAAKSSRSRASVIRLLLRLADRPEVKRLLGDMAAIPEGEKEN